MIIQKIEKTNINCFKSSSKKEFKSKEYLRNTGDACIAIGLLTSGDIFSKKKNETKMESFGKVMLVFGASIIAMRFLNDFVFQKFKNTNET